jgi:DNA-binding winged helix-turn-helix (wHTH) protein/TolB-like protein/lipopolysaccharide biosynthesis regulator YciM
MSQEIKAFYEFGEFRFDIEKRVLWQGGNMVALPPKATAVLALLLEERGNLVERQEIIDKVWSDSFVEEGNLNHAVSALRRVLGSELIKTIPRRGYCFAADVAQLSGPDAPEVFIERRTLSTTVIEEREETVDEAPVRQLSPSSSPSARHYIEYGAAAAVVLLLAIGVWILTAGPSNASRTGRSSIKSLAVLPLRSFSRDNTDEELRLRITDALITKLGRLDTLVIRPTNSVLRFASEDHDAVEAGEELGVDAVLDGRVQEENGRLRVTLQLLSVPGGEQIWSEQFDGRADEILALQDSISDRFRRDLAFVETRAADVQLPINSDAYEAYLKGRFLWNQRKKESYDTALEYFENSVRIDPNFALGYAGIADCYYMLHQRNVLSTLDAYARSEAAAQKALDLDPNLAEAHSSMGAVRALRYNDQEGAVKHYLRAIELNPNLAEAYGRLGMTYIWMQRFDDAAEILRKAESLDPTSLNLAIYHGANFYFSKQFDRAEAQFKRILGFAPGTERAHFFLSRIYEATGRYDEAVEHILKERETLHPASVEPLRAAYRSGGIRAFWQKQIDFMKAESVRMHGLEHHIATRYALLGDAEKACDYVEKNIQVFGAMMNWGRGEPVLDGVRSHPCFAKLVLQDPTSTRERQSSKS